MHVLGTAGHVDHGKSTLVERLTGIDPDRLAEEKRRGLTIDLGFAWLTLPSGREVGIVDVPGHERFVHNMLAGVGSIDATIFVVAANEGWKPQSEEHLAILDLLGARGGVVAMTKRDLVSAEDLDRATRDIAARTSGTALSGAEIVPVSAVTGEGVDRLIAAIEAMLDRTPQAADRGRPRLFVDRAFSIKGAGTVVTGTLTGGMLAVDDEVEILPSGARTRIRSLQTHKQAREFAGPGSRVAINLAGLDRHEIRRGDAVVQAGRWRPTELLDTVIRTVRGLDHAVSPRGAYRLYLGSAETPARVHFLDAGVLEPGGGAYARITLEQPIVADALDRFVIRDGGRQETVAGGVVLDAHPFERRLAGHRRSIRVGQLKARRDADHASIGTLAIEERGVVRAADLVWLTGAAGATGRLRSYAVSDEWWESTTGRLEEILRSYHSSNSLARGMPLQDARAATGIDDPRLFGELVDALAGRVAADGPLLRLASHAVALSPEQRAAIARDLDRAAFSPPSRAELARTHGAPLVTALIEAGDLVAFAQDFVLSRERYEEGRRVISEAIKAEGGLTTSRARELLGTSRKYAIPLLEHFDATGITRRQGDVRVLAAGDG